MVVAVREAVLPARRLLDRQVRACVPERADATRRAVDPAQLHRARVRCAELHLLRLKQFHVRIPSSLSSTVAYLFVYAYRSTGAVAELIDVSCIVSQPSFATLQNDLFNAWTNLIPYPIQAVIDLLHLVNPPEVLAQHYFVPNPTTGQGVSPKWDFTSSGAFQGSQNAYIVAKGKGTLPAPTNATRDVAWLDVTGIQGDIANEVFRFDTVGGQPPSSVRVMWWAW